MMPIGDNAKPAVIILQRGTYHARLPALQWRHSIVQMRKPAQALRKRVTSLGIGGPAMAAADDDALLH